MEGKCINEKITWLLRERSRPIAAQHQLSKVVYLSWFLGNL